MALVKYNNNSISSVTATAALPAGAMTLISTSTTSSGVSTVSIASGIDSTYPIYVFKLINIHISNDYADLTVNFRDGGSSYDATKTSTSFYAGHDEGDSATGLTYNPGKDLAQGTGANPICSIGNANDESANGTIYLFSPSSTTYVKHFISNIHCMDGYNYSMNHFTSGYCNVTAAIDGIQFGVSAGTIDSGVIKMYGIKDS
jgi:hypothetical protein